MRKNFAGFYVKAETAARIRKGLAFATIAAGLVAVALIGLSCLHFVDTDKGLVVVKKRFVGLAATRVDVRGWTWSDALAHDDIYRALVDAGYADVLPLEPSTMERMKEKAQKLTDDAVVAGTNAWTKVKDKVTEWRE